MSTIEVAPIPPHLYGLDRPEIVHLSPSDLLTDDAYQRLLKKPRVRKMTANYSPSLMQPVEVNLRSDGTFYVIDGQHRLALARALGIELITCRMHYGLTPEQEAAMWDLFNHERVNPTKIERFKARLAAKEELALSIAEVLGRFDMEVGRAPSKSVVACVDALDRIASRPGGLDRLHDSIRIVTDAWGGNPSGHQAPVLQAIDVLLRTYPYRGSEDSGVQRKRLTLKLAEVDPSILVARAQAAIQSGSKFMRVAALIVESYNKGIRKDRLDPTRLVSAEARGERISATIQAQRTT